MPRKCDTCLHEKVCALWRANELQDASCYSDNCYTPAADVEPVRHGRWVKMTGMMPPEFHGHYACSECGWSGKNFLNELQFRRCPKCGAKMGGEDNA